MAAQPLRPRRHPRRIHGIHSHAKTLLLRIHWPASRPQKMTCPFSLSRFRLLRRLCSMVCAVAGCCMLPAARAQNIDKPLQSIDEDITAFAYAPDGRIVYSVYRRVKTKVYDALEHDDIWLQDARGKRRRLLEGQKYTHGTQPFSYLVNSFRWSPNGRMILDAANPTWLLDNAAIAYLSEAVKPRQLFSLKFTRPATGSFPSSYEGRTFRDIAWLPGANSAIAIEQNRTVTGPLRLQRLDLLTDNDKELATLESYEGGLSVSPSGKKIAYFIDKEVLEIRDLTSLSRVARLRIGLGIFRWSPDESRILLKRALEKKSGDLVWIDFPPLTPVPANHEIPVSEPQPIPILHGISFRDFAISPDGRSLAVVITGKRNLLVFPLPR